MVIPNHLIANFDKPLHKAINHLSQFKSNKELTQGVLHSLLININSFKN
jgi:hypothetical protein